MKEEQVYRKLEILGINYRVVLIDQTNSRLDMIGDTISELEDSGKELTQNAAKQTRGSKHEK